jgi:hypothetical protein
MIAGMVDAADDAEDDGVAGSTAAFEELRANLEYARDLVRGVGTWSG